MRCSGLPTATRKVRTLLETAQAVLGPSRAPPELHLVDDAGTEHTHPAVVLISNNPYALDRPVVTGTRPTLDSGRLGIIVLDPPRDPAVGPDAHGTRRLSKSTPPSRSTPELTARQPISRRRSSS